MKQSRLEALADGIFAIVMTLLVLDIHLPINRVPTLIMTNGRLWSLLALQGSTFLAYALSFALLFTYWRAHHYIMSSLAKNIDVRVTNINALMFFLVSLIPFTTQVLAEYPNTQLAVFLYSIHVILIGLTLIWMRNYVKRSRFIEINQTTAKAERNAFIRNVVPIICSVFAILISFLNTQVAIVLLTVAILFNLHPTVTELIHWIVNMISPPTGHHEEGTH